MRQTDAGALIAQLRKEQGLTQKQLAEQLHISDRTISKWERGVSHSYRYHTKHNNTTLIRDLAHPKRTYRNPP